jgi:TolB-like protein
VIGETISHYRIVQKLGGGGMGEVYEAEDLRLGRRVALKFIPDSLSGNSAALERFQLEARTTSSLNHPGICTIYDIASHNGLPIIVMELLKGETLKQRLQRNPLTPSEAIEYGIQLAVALEAAHQRGIIHRDIKPGNIFLTTHGHAKILDFGLAKLKGEPRVEQPLPVGATRHDPSEAITNLSVIPGTTLYMSPEQAQGKLLDERTDLFSLGVVLYEAVTGRRPFAGRNALLTMSAIQTQRPVSPAAHVPELPVGLEQVLGGLLEKDRRLRYQSARELAEDLRRLKRQIELHRGDGSDTALLIQPTRTFRKLTIRQVYLILGIAGLIAAVFLALTVWWAKHARAPESPQAKHTIAVLPFHNIAEDPDLDYLRFAIPDELVKMLAYTPSLEIRPVPTAPNYSKGAFDPQQAGRDLKAEIVITGHFMKVGNRLSITADAVDVRHNQLLWQDSFYVPEQNLLTLQEELSNTVRQGLLPALGARTAMFASATRPRNPDAYDLYLRGSSLPHDPAPNSTAVTMLEHSVELDPDFAPAWDALGLRYYYDATYAGAGQETYDKSAAAYERALRLDPNLITSVAHLVRIRAERGRVADAYREARDLVARRPENAQAHFTLAYVLRYAGLLHSAARECDAALALDPTNYDFRSCSFVFFELGNSARAMEYLRLDSGSEWANSVLPSILLREGKTDEARVAAAKVPDGGTWFGGLLQACLLPVGSDQMKRLTERATPELLNLRDAELRYYHGAILSYCGQTDVATQLLQSAIADRYCATEALQADPLLQNLRISPAFASVAAASKKCEQDFAAATK